MDDLRGEVIADARRATGVSAEDLAIAAMVVLPFTLTLAILVSWMVPLPSLVLQLVWLVLTAVATAWNAGWRARTGG